jgi:hypothetical protein
MITSVLKIDILSELRNAYITLLLPCYHTNTHEVAIRRIWYFCDRKNSICL